MSEKVVSDTEKAAKFSFKLKADSGYSATGDGRISAEQYGRIMAILNEGDTVMPKTEEVGE